MTLWACPHCHEVIELRGEPREPKCECGAILERCDPVEIEIPAKPEAA